MARIEWTTLLLVLLMVVAMINAVESRANPGCLFQKNPSVMQGMMDTCFPKEKHVVFSVDVSSSMKELAFLKPVERRIDLVVLTIKKALIDMGRLKTGQSIQIQLFNRDVIKTFGPILINGDNDAKSAINWLNQYTANIEGKTSIDSGLKNSVLSLMSKPQTESRAVYLMSDGGENVDNVLNDLKTGFPPSKDRPIVNTLLFLLKQDQYSVELMTRIANHFGGYFRAY